MRVTMVKKVLANGDPCAKCKQAEDTLKARGLWQRIDEVVWAVESDPECAGMQLAKKHGVTLAPFFILEDEQGERVLTSTLKVVRELSPGVSAAAPAPVSSASEAGTFNRVQVAAELEDREPSEILRWGLERFGKQLALAFSGAEDVVLIDMAVKLGLPFCVFSLDTGRLHPQTYRYLERVREHYALELRLVTPDPKLLEPFVEKKGLFSFYRDGHGECCAIRKVEPLQRALQGVPAWVTGQRRDQSPTRSDLPVLQSDPASPERVKLNPLANWSLARVWQYIRDNDVPANELHESGFVSIGCEPCTRAPRPGEHERAGRWWWEEETQRECGLHLAK